MGEIRDLGYAGNSGAWRKFDTNGLPATPAHSPKKESEIWPFIDKIDEKVEALEEQTFSGKGFATVSDMDAATGDWIVDGVVVSVLADPAGDVTNGNGQYLRDGSDWVWKRPLPAKATDITAVRNIIPLNDSTDNKSIFLTKPVYSRGMRNVMPAFGTNICGIATTWEVVGSYQFDAVRIAIKVETVGKPILVEIWNAAGTSRVAGATIIPKFQEDLYEIPLDANVQFSNGTKPYIRAFSADGATRLVCAIPTVTPADDDEAGQKYEVKADIEPSISNWKSVTGGSIPIWFELFSSIGRTRRGGGTAPNQEKVILPPRIFGVVGEEMAVYFDNLRVSTKRRVWRMSATATPMGQLQEKRWVFTPGSTVSNKSIILSSQDPDTLTTFGSGTMRIDVVDPNTGGGSKRILCIGDSQTAAGLMTARALALAAKYPSGLGLTFIGTKGTGSNKHEGVSGAKLQDYYNSATVGGVTNVFYNSGSGYFDADYYITNSSPGTIDVVHWMLCVNDYVGLSSDIAANAQVPTSLTQLAALIGLITGLGPNGFKQSAASSAKHIIALTIRASRQDAFGNVFQFATDSYRYRRSILTWVDACRDYFGSREADGVFLNPLVAVVDPENGFSKVLPQPASEAVKRAYKANTYATYTALLADLVPAAGTRAYCTDTDTYHVKMGPTTKGGWMFATPEQGVLMRDYDALHPAVNSPFDGVGYDEMGSGFYGMTSCLSQLGSI